MAASQVARPLPMTVRFGVQGSGQLVGGLPEPRIFRDVATLAEDLGFDSLWAGEHLSFRSAILDVVVALSGFAAVTERIALGAGVVLLERLPTRTARAVMLPARVGGTLETMRAYLTRRYGVEFSPEAVDRYCLWGDPELRVGGDLP